MSPISRIFAYRRSPRSIDRLCRDERLRNFTKAESALIIALSHLSGWCAERIALAVKKITSKEVSAEEVWHFYWRWILKVSGSGPTLVSEDDLGLMRAAIEEAKLDVESENGTARPLHKTVEPITVPFVGRWSPSAPPPNKLCEGYTYISCAESIAYLESKSPRSYGKLTPPEQQTIARFGSTVECLVKDTLRRWSRELRALLSNGNSLQSIDYHAHVRVIIKHLEIFQQAWESKFGMMEIPEVHKNCKNWQGLKGSDIYITTTGFGCKVLLGLMMTDRISVLDRKRTLERREACFLRMDVSTLDEDSKECFVCKTPMDKADEDGVKEVPICLTFCCDKVIGKDCMKKWCEAKGKGRHNCPFCRSKFSDRLWDKLFALKEDDIHDDAGGVTMRPAGLSRGRRNQTIVAHSELGSPFSRNNQNQPLRGYRDHTISSPNVNTGSPRGGFVERWGEIARSRRRNRGRPSDFEDNFDNEG